MIAEKIEAISGCPFTFNQDLYSISAAEALTPGLVCGNADAWKVAGRKDLTNADLS
jgi:hypothetical protein